MRRVHKPIYMQTASFNRALLAETLPDRAPLMLVRDALHALGDSPAAWRRLASDLADFY